MGKSSTKHVRFEDGEDGEEYIGFWDSNANAYGAEREVFRKREFVYDIKQLTLDGPWGPMFIHVFIHENELLRFVVTGITQAAEAEFKRNKKSFATYLQRIWKLIEAELWLL